MTLRVKEKKIRSLTYPTDTRVISFSKKKAVPADAKATSELKSKEEAKQFKINEERKAAVALAERINNIEIGIKMDHGQDGRLYGSVTAKDIAEELKRKLSIDVDKRKIVMKDAIKAYGKFTVELKLLSDVVAKFNVLVHE